MATQTITLTPTFNRKTTTQYIEADINNYCAVRTGDPIKATFNISKISGCTNAVLNFTVSKANTTYLNGYSESNMSKSYARVRIKAYTLQGYTSNIFKTGDYKYSLISSQVANLNTSETTYVQFDTLVKPDNSPNELTDIAKLEYGISSCTLTVTVPAPTFSTFSVNGTSIDKTITANFTASDYDSWKLEVVNSSGKTVLTKTGTTETSYSITAGTITSKGKYTFKLTVYNGLAEVTKTNEVTLTMVEPKIVSLEPSGVAQNINNIINITWVSQNQNKYTLEVGEKTYSGTTGNKVSIPKNTFKSGTITSKLTITYTSSWGQVRTATKTVTFTAYGNPETPILDETTVYNSALPTFKWVAPDQVSFQLKIRNSSKVDIYDSGEITSTAKSHTITTELENNMAYEVTLRVKNQYNLYSEWAVKEFETYFEVPEKPEASVVVTSTPSVIISFTAVSSTIFESSEIWRKTDYTDWIRIAHNMSLDGSYEDKFVGSEKYYYKVRAVGSTGGIIESDIIEVQGNELKIKDFHFTNIEDFSQEVVLIGNPKVQFSNNRDVASTVFAGCSAPKVEKGDTKYTSMSLSFAVKMDIYNSFLDLVDNSRVLLYRDGRGRKFYCQLTDYPTGSYMAGSYMNISFNIVEVAFTEGNFYDGSGERPKLYFDGTWYFDGSQLLDGVI